MYRTFGGTYWPLISKSAMEYQECEESMFHHRTQRNRELFQQEGLREDCVASLSKWSHKVPSWASEAIVFVKSRDSVPFQLSGFVGTLGIRVGQLRIPWPSFFNWGLSYYGSNPRLVFYMKIRRDGCIVSGSIVLPYLITVLLEVDFKYGHLTSKGLLLPHPLLPPSWTVPLASNP